MFAGGSLDRGEHIVWVKPGRRPAPGIVFKNDQDFAMLGFFATDGKRSDQHLRVKDFHSKANQKSQRRQNVVQEIMDGEQEEPNAATEAKAKKKVGARAAGDLRCEAYTNTNTTIIYRIARSLINSKLT